MIAEAPSSTCTRRATPYRRRQMASARRAVRLCSKARVVGVAFFDYKHGQTGVAPNAIELHPILGFACLFDQAVSLANCELFGPPLRADVCKPSAGAKTYPDCGKSLGCRCVHRGGRTYGIRDYQPFEVVHERRRPTPRLRAGRGERIDLTFPDACERRRMRGGGAWD
jgi:hypothetical protein